MLHSCVIVMIVLYSVFHNTDFSAGAECCKNPKISDTRKFAVITLKVEQDGFSLEQCTQKMQPELQTV